MECAADDTTFMRLALARAEEAGELGEFPVGAVLVAGGEVVAEGQRHCSGGGDNSLVNELDHAEMTALRNLLTTRRDIPPSAVTVYSTLEPCLMCYSTLVVNGVRRVVYACEDPMGGGTSLPLDRLSPLYRQRHIDVRGGVLRRQSLRLFQKFFRSSGSSYLADTLLARHILAQRV